MQYFKYIFDLPLTRPVFVREFYETLFLTVHFILKVSNRSRGELNFEKMLLLFFQVTNRFDTIERINIYCIINSASVMDYYMSSKQS